MKQLKEVLKTSFDANLADDFSKRARFEPTMDYVEYVSTDTITVFNRIDPYLTLIHSSEDKKLVGFRLKGFRYVFNQLKPVLALNEGDFLPLMRVIEQILTIIGNEVCQDQEKFSSYQQAFKLAKEDNIVISLPELVAAA